MKNTRELSQNEVAAISGGINKAICKDAAIATTIGFFAISAYAAFKVIESRDSWMCMDDFKCPLRIAATGATGAIIAGSMAVLMELGAAQLNKANK